jgi:two-component system, LytTR family, response regulator AlgR
MGLEALSVLVVDDEALARSRLRTLLADCTHPVAQCRAEAANAEQALALLQSERFDVVLLDIHMPGMSGLVLAQTIAALPQAPRVVFITAHAAHAVRAFELEATDYLTKPVRLERLQAALLKVQRLMQVGTAVVANLSHEVLVIQDRGRTERVPLIEVIYFKAELKYVTVRTLRRSYILDGSLGELEERYASTFMRIHRNALVARHAVRALQKHYSHEPGEEGEGWAVRLNGLEELLMVSRRQLAAVREAISS